jgi:hypothetical protein
MDSIVTMAMIGTLAVLDVMLRTPAIFGAVYHQPMKSKRRRPDTHQPGTQQLLEGITRLDGESIDALYGLEPVFEPGRGDAAAAELGVFVELQCPWCGEPYGSMLDLTDASRCYIEDCQICCRPIEVRLEVSEQGELDGVSTSRAD